MRIAWAMMAGLAIPRAMAAPAGAGEKAECPAPTALPAPLAGWAATHRPVDAAADVARAGNVRVAIGTAAELTLQPVEKLGFARAPERPASAGTLGGLVTLDVSEAGTYRVALGSGAWVDVVRDGASVQSVAHGHGPACSGIAKMVDFTLTPGRHVVQLSGSKATSIGLLVARLP